MHRVEKILSIYLKFHDSFLTLLFSELYIGCHHEYFRNIKNTLIYVFITDIKQWLQYLLFVTWIKNKF